MADLTPRADCSASGVESQYAAAVKGDLEPIFLCEHHARVHAAALKGKGWKIVLLGVGEKVPA